jgi:lysophospholipase L1-like esterase
MRGSKEIGAGAVAIAALLAVMGCEGDGGGGVSQDVGENDPNVVVALGDSITVAGRGTVPYASTLPGLIGKQVVNAGKGGDRANGGLARVGGLLSSHSPGYLLIFLGSNDAIHGGDPSSVKESLRGVIRAARDNQTVPIIATIPPMVNVYDVYQGGVTAINDAIRALASEESAYLVNLETALGANPDLYLDSRGLHPTQAGQDRIAQAFAAVF